MVDIKFVFSNIRFNKEEKSSSRRAANSRVKRQTGDGKIKPEEKQTPLFYSHKIRAPKYEYF